MPCCSDRSEVARASEPDSRDDDDENETTAVLWIGQVLSPVGRFIVLSRASESQRERENTLQHWRLLEIHCVRVRES